MRVETVFVSIGAKDHRAQCAWWSALIGRKPERRPMPSCCEWDLAPGVLFQVLDNPSGGAVDVVSLRIADLDAEIARLRGEGIEPPAPRKVEGFDALYWTRLRDPEGNEVNLLEGA